MLQEVATDKAPKAIGPYSQAIVFGDWVFTAGQIPINPETGEAVAGPIERQTEQVMKNLKAVLEAAGSDLARVVKTTVYLNSMDDFQVFNKTYASFFQEPYPARSTVEVANLPKGVLLEVEAIAYRK
jgi:2-iminobutanoate/2-iminopropanoate deaminase